MASAIDDHDEMAGTDQRGNLITPIPAMAEAAMQQDHGSAGPVCRVPDSRTVMAHVALIAGGRQRCSTVRFEMLEVVVE